jgi:PilZ domain
MEHRLSLRTPLTMNVAIYYNGLGLLQGRSLDVSRHGMFVATGPMVLPLYAIVDVAFPLESGKYGEPPQRTPAMVVRQGHKGVGLMFAKEVNTSPLELYGCDRQDYPHSIVVDVSSG